MDGTFREPHQGLVWFLGKPNYSANSDQFRTGGLANHHKHIPVHSFDFWHPVKSVLISISQFRGQKFFCKVCCTVEGQMRNWELELW